MQRPIDENIKEKLSKQLLEESKKAIGSQRHIDFKLMEELIAQGADIHYQDEDGETFFHYLCACNYADFSITPQEEMNQFGNFYIDINLIKNILEKGINVNIQNKAGATCLHRALGHTPYNVSLIMLLIEHGANLNIKSNLDYLSQACDYRNNFPKLAFIKFLSTRIKDAENFLAEQAPAILRAIADQALNNPQEEQFNDLGLVVLTNTPMKKLWNITLPDQFSVTPIYKILMLLKDTNNFREVIDFLKSHDVKNSEMSKDMKKQNNFFAPSQHIKQKSGNSLQKTPEQIIEEALEKFSPSNTMQPKI